MIEENNRYESEMEIKIPYYDDNTRISNSALGWFLKSPRYYKSMLNGEIEKKSTGAMENGTMTHMYLLQPDEFKATYRILNVETPTSAQQKQFCKDYIDSKADKPILKAAEAFKANYSTNGKADDEIARRGLEMALKLKPYIKWLRSNNTGIKIISWSDLNSLKVTKENVILHKKANELLYNIERSPGIISFNEFHINWVYDLIDDKHSVGLDCKSLIDKLIIDTINKKIILCDIKTTASTVKDKFRESFDTYDYGRQMAFYWMAIEWFFENILEEDFNLYSRETYIVAVQNNGDYNCKVYSVKDEIIVNKKEQIKTIFSDIWWHTRANAWEYTKEYYEGDGTEQL